MNNVIKSFVATLILTFALSMSYGQKTIELRIDSTNDTLLVLSDNGETERGNIFGRTVIWTIADKQIDSFYLIAKTFEYYPFNTRLDRVYETTKKLTVERGADTGEWYYEIKWKKRNGNVYGLDPKIRVKPGISTFAALLAIVGLIIMTITSIVLYRKFQGAKTRLTEIEQQHK